MIMLSQKVFVNVSLFELYQFFAKSRFMKLYFKKPGAIIRSEKRRNVISKNFCLKKSGAIIRSETGEL
jgi:hypothetical protein